MHPWKKSGAWMLAPSTPQLFGESRCPSSARQPKCRIQGLKIPAGLVLFLGIYTLSQSDHEPAKPLLEVLDLAMNWPQGRRKVLIELKGGFSGVPEWVQSTLRRVGMLKKEPEPAYPNLARLVAEALAPYSQQVEEGFIVAQSFHQPYLHELRHLLPSLRVMYLSLSSATGMLEKENLQHVGLGFAGVAVRHSSLTASALKRLHLTQGQVFAWTVDAVDDIEAAVAIGVDGIITNYPDRALAILAGSLPPRKRSSAAAVYPARLIPL